MSGQGYRNIYSDPRTGLTYLGTVHGTLEDARYCASPGEKWEGTYLLADPSLPHPDAGNVLAIYPPTTDKDPT